MADGQPIIQGSIGSTTNTSGTETTFTNGVKAGQPSGGTGLHLFSSREVVGDGLYAVAQYQGSGVSAFSYKGEGVLATAINDGDGVQGRAWRNGTGVHGIANSAGVFGEGLSGGTGVDGRSREGSGVRGWGRHAGVIGEADAATGIGVEGVNRNGTEGGVGVLGFARIGMWGDGTIGVVGRSVTSHGIGVEGDALREGGIGVFGATSAATGGVGVYATAPNPGSSALQVQGVANFSSSGLAKIPAGATQITVKGPPVGTTSLVLATVQQDQPGVAVRAAVPDPAAGEFTIHLTQAPQAETAVAWFVIN